MENAVLMNLLHTSTDSRSCRHPPCWISDALVTHRISHIYRPTLARYMYMMKGFANDVYTPGPHSSWSRACRLSRDIGTWLWWKGFANDIYYTPGPHTVADLTHAPLIASLTEMPLRVVAHTFGPWLESCDYVYINSITQMLTSGINSITVSHICIDWLSRHPCMTTRLHGMHPDYAWCEIMRHDQLSRIHNQISHVSAPPNLRHARGMNKSHMYN